MERPTVVIELAETPQLARDISAGGVFVPGCELRINSDCTLLVRGPTEEIELAARVVYVELTTGAGLELVGFSPALREHLTRLMTAWVPEVELGALEVSSEESPVGDVASDIGDTASGDDDGDVRDVDFDAVETLDADADADAEARLETDPDATLDADADADTDADAPVDLGFDPSGDGDAELTDEEQADPAQRKRALNLHERLRGLTLAQQVKVAQTGDPQERILLERFYNKAVWEPLLRNPRLTPPEVARIARMGTLPRVLLEIIVNNGGWLQVPEIRRALLSNPRLGTDQILRVLRMLPKHELKLASTQTAYPSSVRDAAKRLIKDAGGGG